MPSCRSARSRHWLTPRPAPARAQVLGVPLALSDYGGVLDWIDATIARGARASVSARPSTRDARARGEEIRRRCSQRRSSCPTTAARVGAARAGHRRQHAYTTRADGATLPRGPHAPARRSTSSAVATPVRSCRWRLRFASATRHEIAGAHATAFTPQRRRATKRTRSASSAAGRSRVGRHRTATPGAVDGENARPPERTCPAGAWEPHSTSMRASSARPRPGWAQTASNGPTG